MKLEAGKYYRTRDGLKAKVLCVDAPDADRPCVGYIATENRIVSISWDADGMRMTDATDPSSFDLIAEWREPVKVSGWVNVYRDEHGLHWFGLCDTQEEADRCSNGARIACIYVTGTEGVEP